MTEMKVGGSIQKVTALILEAGSISETSVNFCQTAWRNSPTRVIFIVATTRTSNLPNEGFFN
jgi:hypothetical protein